MWTILRWLVTKAAVLALAVQSVGMFVRVCCPRIHLVIAYNAVSCLVCSNDPFLAVDAMAYQFRYDSTHGQFSGTVEAKESDLVINGEVVKTFAEYVVVLCCVVWVFCLHDRFGHGISQQLLLSKISR